MSLIISACSQTNAIKIIDVRTFEEFSESHVAGAINIDILDEETFIESIINFNRNTEIIIYCRSGNRSSQAVEILEHLGFTEVTDAQTLENAALVTGRTVNIS